MDYFKTVGGLGLGSRLRRLSDTYFGEVKTLYAQRGFEFEPRFFPLFSLLHQSGDTTVTDAATKLKLTHPHISQLCKDMTKQGLLKIKKNPTDSRSRVITLSQKGTDLAASLLPLWADIQRGVDEVIQQSDPDFLSALDRMESILRRQPFSERVNSLSRQQKAGNCRILNFSSKLKPCFENLNREWIEKFFAIEPHDVRIFADPEKEIIKKGGEIVFAESNGEIVGTCTLTVEGNHFELAKLAVSHKAKGLGIGQLLCQEIIKRAKQNGAKSLQLTTNTCLIPAVQLYKKLGFKEVYRGQHPIYKRVNLVMEKII